MMDESDLYQAARQAYQPCRRRLIAAYSCATLLKLAAFAPVLFLAESKPVLQFGLVCLLSALAYPVSALGMATVYLSVLQGRPLGLAGLFHVFSSRSLLKSGLIVGVFYAVVTKTLQALSIIAVQWSSDIASGIIASLIAFITLMLTALIPLRLALLPYVFNQLPRVSPGHAIADAWRSNKGRLDSYLKTMLKVVWWRFLPLCIWMYWATWQTMLIDSFSIPVICGLVISVLLFFVLMPYPFMVEAVFASRVLQEFYDSLQKER